MQLLAVLLLVFLTIPALAAPRGSKYPEYVMRSESSEGGLTNPSGDDTTPIPKQQLKPNEEFIVEFDENGDAIMKTLQIQKKSNILPPNPQAEATHEYLLREVRRMEKEEKMTLFDKIMSYIIPTYY